MHQIKHSFVLLESTSANDIIQILELNGIGFLALTDLQGKLIGVVSDGDIRRCVLENNFNLDKLINRTPDIWPSDKPKKSAINHLRRIHRRHIPIVDIDHTLMEVLCLDDIEFNLRENPVVLMAGGLGTRLHPLTLEKPKPMLHIANKPILENIIEKLVDQGFRKFFISINYKGEQIKQHFGDGSNWDIEINYIEEDKRLGTAGALYKLHDVINTPFIVMNADVLTDLNVNELLDYHINIQSQATMCVFQQSYQVPFGVIESDDDNNIKDIREKPKIEYFINTGIYALSPVVFQYIPENEFFDMPTLFEKVHQSDLTAKVYELNGYWNDIGHLEEYQQLCKEED